MMACAALTGVRHSFKVAGQLHAQTVLRDSMKTTLVTSLALVAALTASVCPAADGDAVAGKKKTEMCEGCHGIARMRTAFPDVYTAPRLGGQNAAYIAKVLQDYKSGARKHPSMEGIAGSMSEKDMADLAAYYASDSAH